MPGLFKWQDWPLALRLTLYMTILVTGIVVSLTWITLRREQANQREALQQQASLLLSSLSVTAGGAVADGETGSLDTIFTDLSRQEVLLFGRLYSADGRIIADALAPSEANRLADDPLAEQIARSERTVFVWQPDRLIAWQPVMVEGQRLGAVAIGLPTSSPDQALTAIRNEGIGLAVGAVILGMAVAFIFARTVTRPLEKMILISRRMAIGDTNARIHISGQNELGALAEAFNSLAEELQQSISDLEQRTLAMATSAEISRRLSTILDTSELVGEVVTQIQTSFGYYHAHIYLLADSGKNLVMVGGTGQAGQAMLAKRHQIALGQGLVGRAAASKLSILVTDVKKEETWLPNPLLPETRAETAVPIMYGGELLGVLDVQHNVIDGLNQQDVDLLESIAAQVAIALQNARYYHQAQFKTSREALFSQISQTVQNTTDLETALQVAVRELGRVLEARQIRIQLQPKRNGRHHEEKSNG